MNSLKEESMTFKEKKRDKGPKNKRLSGVPYKMGVGVRVDTRSKIQIDLMTNLAFLFNANRS